jgi:hypothetical protein
MFPEMEEDFSGLVVEIPDLSEGIADLPEKISGWIRACFRMTAEALHERLCKAD